MNRCIQLARLGKGRVAPNPLVGAVLVYGDRIIGEGYHEEYGKAHAEVNCIASVAPEDLELIQQSTMFVSLEPCSHFGKTPPCTNLIVEKKIKKVVIGCADPFPEVSGNGIRILRENNVEVVTGVLESECKELNRYFFHFYQSRRPYIILKWAQSADGFIAANGDKRTLITNSYTNRVVHGWRSEVMAIMVGSNTVRTDDPELTTRHWPGNNPVRIIIDPGNDLDTGRKIFNADAPTLIFNKNRNETKGNVAYVATGDGDMLAEVIDSLFQKNLHSVLVEGGAKLLQSFIDQELWDEARVITNDSLQIGSGLPAPVLYGHKETGTDNIFSDTIRIYHREK
jgi:diaminohydroxyphosphoribosylaminopyrimidine deaminase / 5-amino-6-(5-phosphoribosylamino)uracil reductase